MPRNGVMTEPDGYLCEGPLFEIVPKLPTTVRDIKEYLLAWQEFAFSRGYTAVGDAGAEVIHRAAPQAYYELQEEGKLKLRTYAWMYVADNSDAKTEIARIAAQRAEMSGEYFHIVGAKAFLDIQVGRTKITLTHQAITVQSATTTTTRWYS